jgi:hypothetical protein
MMDTVTAVVNAALLTNRRCRALRDIDQYGYAAFEANCYWVPGRRKSS